MPSVSSVRALKAKLPRHTGRYLILGAIVVLALIVARAAYASTVFFYYHDFASPQVPHSSPGWNYRDYNRVCRDDPTYHSYGLARAADYDQAGYRDYDTGQVLTQCQYDVVARIEVYGYWLVRCWNSDSGGMILLCQSTKP